MPRIVNPVADALIDKEIPCLDKGHVMLIDYMGDDAAIVQAARVSYGKDTEFDAVKDRKLIHYLMAHNHATPFEMVQIKVRMKLPIFVARQWVRHRTASLNEVSGRYTQLKDEFFLPSQDQLRLQSTTNKQGSGGLLTDAEKQAFIHDEMQEDQQQVYQHYDSYVRGGMAKEMARINLPVSTYTEWYWDQNLRNMLHLLNLRLDSHAQYEIRVYANALWDICKAIAPMACEAFEEYQLHAERFSRTEMEALRKLIFNPCIERGELAEVLGIVQSKLGDRAMKEFETKLLGKPL